MLGRGREASPLFCAGGAERFRPAREPVGWPTEKEKAYPGVGKTGGLSTFDPLIRRHGPHNQLHTSSHFPVPLKTQCPRSGLVADISPTRNCSRFLSIHSSSLIPSAPVAWPNRPRDRPPNPSVCVSGHRWLKPILTIIISWYSRLADSRERLFFCPKTRNPPGHFRPDGFDANEIGFWETLDWPPSLIGGGQRADYESEGRIKDSRQGQF